MPSTRDDDSASGDAAAFVHACGTQPDKIEARLRKVKDPAGRDLISKLLQPVASNRLQVHEALNHVFLNPKASDADAKMTLILKSQARLVRSVNRIEKGIIKLKHLAKETLEQVKRSEEVLRKAVFDVSEIKTPTCFVILPHKLSGHVSENAERENAEMHEHLLGIADQALMSTEEDDDGGNEVVGSEDEGGGLERSLKGSPKSAIAKAHRKVMSVKTRMDAWLSSKIYDESVYLYLVDELTGMPVLGDGDRPIYPIEIKRPKEQLRQMVPLMCLSISAMSLVSNGSGLARMFGIPAPNVSKDVQNKMRAFAKKMSTSNTAEQFDCLQASIDTALLSMAVNGSATTCTKDNTAVRGKALREFEGFLAENDKDSNFAGLRRVMTECGAVMWTSEGNVDPISLSTQVAAIAEEKSVLQAQVISGVPCFKKYKQTLF